MKYQVELKPKAIKELKYMPKEDGKRVVEKLKFLENNIQRDVNKLINYSIEYKNASWRLVISLLNRM